MKPTSIGILREGKIPPDHRVPFTPRQAQEMLQRWPHISIICQPSKVRCFTDDEYREAGVEVREDVSGCDVLMGVKEVPIDRLVPGRMYFFFSHTIKKQPYNKKLLQEILRRKITLIDYEALKDIQGNRLVAFGRFAGIVGAYNALYTYGLKKGGFTLRRAYECFDVNDLKLELRKVQLPPLRIVLTGAGRVGKGAMEALDTAGIRKVTPRDFLQKSFMEPVYVQLSSAEYHLPIDGGVFRREEFHESPAKYYSTFGKYAEVSDILIAGAYWNPKAPRLFTEEEMKRENFRIRIIADITCDINGSIPSTRRASTILDPLYDYEPKTGELHPAFSGTDNITVMAIDNLPCELPRSASEEFGRDLIDYVMKPLLGDDPEGVVGRAIITTDGKLTPRFAYLSDYVSD